MLDDEDGIAEIAQARKRVEEAIVVALVEANAWFVQDVEHADKAGADLRGEANALGFAAAERAAFAIQREIAETNVFQEAEAGADFANDFGGDLPFEIGELEGGEKFIGAFDRERTDVHD